MSKRDPFPSPKPENDATLGGFRPPQVSFCRFVAFFLWLISLIKFSQTPDLHFYFWVCIQLSVLVLSVNRDFKKINKPMNFFLRNLLLTLNFPGLLACISSKCYNFKFYKGKKKNGDYIKPLCNLWIIYPKHIRKTQDMIVNWNSYFWTEDVFW